MFTEAELRVMLEAVRQEVEAIKDACENFEEGDDAV